MRIKVLVLLMILPFAGSGKERYTLPVDAFRQQFGDSTSLKRIICFRESGERVFLNTSDKTILVLTLEDGKVQKLMLQSVRISGETLTGTGFNSWIGAGGKKVLLVASVSAVAIQPFLGEYRLPYVNLDSLTHLLHRMNDSLLAQWKAKAPDRAVLICVSKEKAADSIKLLEGLSFHVSFRDGQSFQHAIIEHIAGDSITITTSFNQNMAAALGIPYQKRTYPLSAMQTLSVLRSGGYSNRTVDLSKYRIVTEKAENDGSRSTAWYAIDPIRGSIVLYRLLLIDHGFAGITEEGGKTFWWEGAIYR